MQPPLLKFWKILGAHPPSNVKLLNIFLKFFYSAVDLQTYFNIFSQCQGRTNGNPSQTFCDCIDFPPVPPTKQCCWCVVGIFGRKIIIWTQHYFVKGGEINVLAFS